MNDEQKGVCRLGWFLTGGRVARRTSEGLIWKVRRKAACAVRAYVSHAARLLLPLPRMATVEGLVRRCDRDAGRWGRAAACPPMASQRALGGAEVGR